MKLATVGSVQFKLISIAIVTAFLLYTIPIHFVSAAAINSASDTMSDLTINAASSHAIKFTSPTGAAQNTDTIIVTFPADFDFTGKAIAGISLSHGSTTGLEVTETVAAAASGSDWGAAFSGTENRILTLTPPTDGIGTEAITANNKIVIGYTSTNSINPSSPGSYAIAISGSFGDSGEITVNILTNDQVTITATVPQSLTFSISDNSASFGNLSAVSARYASGTASGASSEVEAHTLIVGTNATNGYTMTVNGSTLTSGGNTITAIGGTNSASSVGNEQFGLRLTASGGSGAVNAPYAASGFAFDSGAFPDQVATSSSASTNTTYSARYLANITASTEAGSYTATLTYVATANF
jgi:hypothetical protein